MSFYGTLFVGLLFFPGGLFICDFILLRLLTLLGFYRTLDM